MRYNARTNKIECPFCGVVLHPYGGRFSPWARDVQEIFLCVCCGYWIDMRQAISHALMLRAAILRRAAHAYHYLLSANGHQAHNGNANHKPTLRQRVLRLLVNWLDE